MNLPLGAGQSAILRERLTYGQAHEVRAAYARARVDTVALADIDLALVRAYVASWVVMDMDGAAVDLAHPELAPDDVIQAIGLAALDLWNGKASPKGTPASSRITRPARAPR